MFFVDDTHQKARTGRLVTHRGTILTPAFMPVGTLGSVKSLELHKVEEAGSDIILGNTYHLMLRPGAERVHKLGGLHGLIGWTKPILTDSGGFQIMSLSRLCKMSERGATFRSHIDGSSFELSPERSIEIQCLLGSDIQMVLDWCLPYGASLEKCRQAVELSLRWAQRSKEAFEKFGNKNQKIFGIIQGGTNQTLRALSALETLKMDFDGYAIGGLAVGEKQETMMSVLDETVPFLPFNKPRYLMGVGTPLDIAEAVMRGVDMFDCVYPTRAGRHGTALTHAGKVNLNNACYAEDMSPLDEQSSCPAARVYSKAYLHHLVRCRESLASIIISWNNICYYQSLMQQLRASIRNKTTKDFCTQLWQTWGGRARSAGQECAAARRAAPLAL